jgi:hypothetical protein
MRLALASLFLAAVVVTAGAQNNSTNSDEILRQRLLLQERFNKGWDVQVENMQNRLEARCKAKARKRYSAIHPMKRRKYAKACIERERRKVRALSGR